MLSDAGCSPTQQTLYERTTPDASAHLKRYFYCDHRDCDALHHSLSRHTVDTSFLRRNRAPNVDSNIRDSYKQSNQNVVIRSVCLEAKESSSQ